MATGRALNLHVYPSDMRFESRIERMTGCLQRLGYFSGIEIVGTNDGTQPFVQETPDGRIKRLFSMPLFLRERGKAGRILAFLRWYLGILGYYIFRPVACINAHSLSVLPLCWFLARVKGCAIVYEPHELETETASNASPLKPYVKALERFLAKRSDRVVVVAEGIAEWYQQEYSLKTVLVVRNLPTQLAAGALPSGYYRSRFGIPDSALIFIYQGILGAGRGIELLIDSFRQVLPDRHLVLLGFGDQVPLAEEAARRHSNIHYHPAVAVNELLQYSRAADAGIMMIENVSLSYYYCYPNKYCEYLSAGIPVVFSDFLWVRKEVERYNSGWPAPLDAALLANVVNDIDRADLAERSRGAQRWASENIWSLEEARLVDMYRGLMEGEAA